MKTGLDVLVGEDFKRLKGARIGLLAHPASVDARFAHAVGLLRASKNAELVRLFGPQHGIRGETQDNMVEWEGYTDAATGLEVHSLYGRRRKLLGDGRDRNHVHTAYRAAYGVPEP